MASEHDWRTRRQLRQAGSPAAGRQPFRAVRPLTDTEICSLTGKPRRECRDLSCPHCLDPGCGKLPDVLRAEVAPQEPEARRGRRGSFPQLAEQPSTLLERRSLRGQAGTLLERRSLRGQAGTLLERETAGCAACKEPGRTSRRTLRAPADGRDAGPSTTAKPGRLAAPLPAPGYLPAGLQSAFEELLARAQLVQGGGAEKRDRQARSPDSLGTDRRSLQQDGRADVRWAKQRPPRPGKPIRLGLYVYLNPESNPCKLLDADGEAWVAENLDLLTTTYQNLFSDAERGGTGTFRRIRRQNPSFLGILTLQAESLQPRRFVVDGSGNIDQSKAADNVASTERPEEEWAQRLLTGTGRFSQYMASISAKKRVHPGWPCGCGPLPGDDPRRRWADAQSQRVFRTCLPAPSLHVRLKKERGDAAETAGTEVVAEAMMAVIEGYGADGCHTDNTITSYPAFMYGDKIARECPVEGTEEVVVETHALPNVLYFLGEGLRVEQRSRNYYSAYRLEGYPKCVGETSERRLDKEDLRDLEIYHSCARQQADYYGQHLARLAAALQAEGKWFLPNTTGWYQTGQIPGLEALIFSAGYFDSTVRGAWCEKWVQDSRGVDDLAGFRYPIVCRMANPSLQRRLGQRPLSQWLLQVLHAMLRSASAPFLAISAFSTVDDLQLVLASYLIARSGDWLKLHPYPFLPFALPRVPPLSQPCVAPADRVGSRDPWGYGYFLPLLRNLLGDESSSSYVRLLLDADLGRPRGPFSRDDRFSSPGRQRSVFVRHYERGVAVVYPWPDGLDTSACPDYESWVLQYPLEAVPGQLDAVPAVFFLEADAAALEQIRARSVQEGLDAIRCHLPGWCSVPEEGEVGAEAVAELLLDYLRAGAQRVGEPGVWLVRVPAGGAFPLHPGAGKVLLFESSDSVRLLQEAGVAQDAPVGVPAPPDRSAGGWPWPPRR